MHAPIIIPLRIFFLRGDLNSYKYFSKKDSNSKAFLRCNQVPDFYYQLPTMNTANCLQPTSIQ